jgi:hypothetical protein
MKIYAKQLFASILLISLWSGSLVIAKGHTITQHIKPRVSINTNLSYSKIVANNENNLSASNKVLPSNSKTPSATSNKAVKKIVISKPTPSNKSESLITKKNPKGIKKEKLVCGCSLSPIQDDTDCWKDCLTRNGKNIPPGVLAYCIAACSAGEIFTCAACLGVAIYIVLICYNECSGLITKNVKPSLRKKGKKANGFIVAKKSNSTNLVLANNSLH